MSKECEDNKKCNDDAYCRRIKENLADFTKPQVIQDLLLGKKKNGDPRSLFEVYQYKREVDLYECECRCRGKKKNKKGKKKKKHHVNYREARKFYLK